MRDTGEERVWSKTGSRVRLPRARVSPKTFVVAAALLAMVSLATVGFVAAPAGSPKSPPPPTGVAEPTTQDSPTPTTIDSAKPSPEFTPVEQPGNGWTQPGLSHICKPTAKSGYLIPVPSTSAATAVVYPTQDGSIWVYDRPTNTSHLILPETRQCSYTQPQFYNRRMITFLNQTYVQSVDTVTGQVQAFRTYMYKTEWAWDYALNSKAGVLAVLVSEPNADLKVIVSSLKNPTLYRHKVGVIAATDGFPENLEWSRDGTMLLVSASVSDPHVYVLDLGGNEVIKPIAGTDAHWLGPLHSFIYLSNRNGVTEWTRFDLATGKRTRVFATDVDSLAYIRPVSSPDGSRFAMTEQQNGHVVWFDFKTRKLALIQGAHAYPVWLDNDTIAFSGVTPCNCEYPAFTSTGAVGALSLSTGRWTRMNMTDTIDAQVVF